MGAPRLLLDADVRLLLAPALRRRDLDAVHVREIGLQRADDLRVLETAVIQERALLTHNVADFMTLAREYGTAGRRHHGILLSAQRPVGALLSSVLRALSERSGESLIDAVLWLGS